MKATLMNATNKYKVKVLQQAWRGYDTARLDISVGQPYHEGDKLLALTQWVTERFNAVSVNVCDTLQRFNFELSGLSPDRSYVKAYKQGDEWLQRAAPMINALPQVSVTRWDQWLQDPAYEVALQRSVYLYHHHFGLQHAVNAQIDELWQRKQRRASDHEHIDCEKFKALSIKYLLEEIAVGILMAKECTADIYPGSYLKIWGALAKAGEPTLQSMTRVDFKRNKDSAPSTEIVAPKPAALG